MAEATGTKCECPMPREFARMDTGKILRAACKTWACPSCGPKRRAELSYRIQHGLRAIMTERQGPAKFLTLTLDPNRNAASAANGTKLQAVYASKCWRRLTSMWRERCRRQTKPAPWFVRIGEWRDTTDALHYHVLVVGWLPGYLPDDIKAAGFGMVFDVQQVRRPEAVARYLTQYVTKTTTQKAPRYVNRYSYSRDALPPIPVWAKLRNAFPQAIKAKRAIFAGVDMLSSWWLRPEVKARLEEDAARAREQEGRPPKGTRIIFLGIAPKRDGIEVDRAAAEAAQRAGESVATSGACAP